MTVTITGMAQPLTSPDSMKLNGGNVPAIDAMPAPVLMRKRVIDNVRHHL